MKVGVGFTQAGSLSLDVAQLMIASAGGEGGNVNPRRTELQKRGLQ